MKQPSIWPSALVHEDLSGPTDRKTGQTGLYYLIGIRYGYDELGRFARLMMAKSALKRFSTTIYMFEVSSPHFAVEPPWLDEIFDPLRLGQSVAERPSDPVHR